MTKLKKGFYSRDTVIVAKELLGKYLVHDQNGKKYIGKIIETEAYIGEDDKACHGRFGRTKRNEILFGEPGHAYVYMIYGLYYLLNIITEKEDFPAGVLIRAVEPVSEIKNKNENLKNKEVLDELEQYINLENNEGQYSSTGVEKHRIKELRKLGSGPGVLTRWMEITGIQNGVDLTNSDELYITHELSNNVIPTGVEESLPRHSCGGRNLDLSASVEMTNFKIVETTRVGVEYAGECALKPWRFYIKDNLFVSKR